MAGSHGPRPAQKPHTRHLKNSSADVRADVAVFPRS